jgi:hypothetical protein
MKILDAAFKVMVYFFLLAILAALLRIGKIEDKIYEEMKTMNESVKTTLNNSENTRQEWKDTQDELIKKGLIKSE